MKRYLSVFAVAAALTLTMPAVQAQGPGGGGFNPAVMAKMKAWRNWRDHHKNISAVQQTLVGLNDMEQDSRTQLTKAQARPVLGVMKAWRHKPVMSDSQAFMVNRQLTASLNVSQLKKIATAHGGGFGGGGRRGGGGGGGFGGGRPGGGGGQGGGGGRNMDPSQIPAPHDYNPLNPDTLPFARTRGRMADRLNSLMKTLASAR